MGKFLRFIAIFVSSIVLLFLLVVGSLNGLKFVIYSEYYDIKEDICKNPGINDNFVQQGISVLEEKNLILVSGYMSDDTASRVYITDMDSNAYYLTLEYNGEIFTGHVGGICNTNGIVYIANGKNVYKVSLDILLEAEKNSSISIEKCAELNHKASYIYTDDNYIYVGEYRDEKNGFKTNHSFKNDNGAICGVYNINQFATYKEEELVALKYFVVSDYVQGFCLLSDGSVVLSTSHGLNDSVYYVYENPKDKDGEIYGSDLYHLEKLEKKINGPAMSECLDFSNGKVYTLTESASNKYIFGKFFFANKIIALNL